MSGRFENRVALVTGGDSLPDVGIGRDLCLQRGIPIGIDLGCHMNDHMVSFYLASSPWNTD